MLAITACHKNEIKVTALASLNIVNAAASSGAVKVKFEGGTPNYYSQVTTAINYASNAAYSVLANSRTTLQIAATSDTTTPVVQTQVQLPVGSMYSLLLCGKSKSIDTLWIKENFAAYADSVYGVRFMNLSVNSKPVSIKRKSTGATVASSIAYKGYSSFYTFPCTVQALSEVFEVRDAASDSLLGSYEFKSTVPPPRLNNCSIAWVGETGTTGATAPKTQRINHY
ncbi:hypothetical protein FLA_3717 [Filimonas lacunae]|nr:hypothetical protein FLA_3717 [Filimonas lacunae]